MRTPSGKSSRRQPRPNSNRRRVAVWVAVLAVLGAAAGAVLALPFLLAAVRDGRDAQAVTEQAVASLKRSAFSDAASQFGEARVGFAAASSKLSSVALIPARHVPGLSRQIRTVRALAGAGLLAAQSGELAAQTFASSPPQSWHRSDGSFDLQAMANVEQRLRPAAAQAAQAAAELQASPGSLLVHPVAQARNKALRALDSSAGRLRGAVTGLDIAPKLLGADGPRRHAVLFANLAELRATGGFYGYFAALDTDHGKLTISTQGRPTRDLPPLLASNVHAPLWFSKAWGPLGALTLWQNVNLSPDYPTVADLVVSGFSGSSFGPMDGVLQIDPDGIAALLRVTGPVSIAAWPDPITAENVARISQNEVYSRYTTEPERDTFGQQLLDAALGALSSRPFNLNDATFSAFGDAARGGHIQLYESRQAEEEQLTQLSATGGLDRVGDASDVLGVYTINAAANKIDWYLRRRIKQDVILGPDGTATSQTTVTLQNTAPAHSLPTYVIGPNVGALVSGENRTIICFVRPATSRLLAASVEGKPVAVETYAEGNLRGFRTIITTPPGGTVRVSIQTSTGDAVTGSARRRFYKLHVLRQPTAAPDVLELHGSGPAGWRVSGGGASQRPLSEDAVIDVTLSRSIFGWLLDSLVRNPLHRIGILRA